MLKTAATRLESSRRPAWMVLIGSWKRVVAAWRRPTRLSPPMRMNSRRNPSFGASLDSRPRSVPTKKVSRPRSRSSRATASAGMMWPPVPPPAMRKAPLAPCPAELSRMFRDIHQNSERGQSRQQRAASGADQGQRDAFGRQHIEHHADVHEGLHDDHGGDAERQITAEVVGHDHGGAQAAPEDQPEGQQHAEGADQAHLLADYRVNKIRVGLGEVEQFLLALHK